jgi:hypothetical protein
LVLVCGHLSITYLSPFEKFLSRSADSVAWETMSSYNHFNTVFCLLLSNLSEEPAVPLSIE